MTHSFLQNLGIDKLQLDGYYPSVLNRETKATGDDAEFSVSSPTDGKTVARFKNASVEQLEQTITSAENAGM